MPRRLLPILMVQQRHSMRCYIIKWAVCLDLASTKGARVASTKFQKTGKSPKMLLRCLGVELGTSRVKQLKNKEIVYSSEDLDHDGKVSRIHNYFM